MIKKQIKLVKYKRGRPWKKTRFIYNKKTNTITWLSQTKGKTGITIKWEEL